jgi:hypothetical protein
MRMGDLTRPLGAYGAPDSQPEVTLLRGSSGANYRLRWTGAAYELTSETVDFYEPAGTILKTLATDEQTWVIWRPESQRYEEIVGGTAAETMLHFEITGGTFSYADLSILVKPVDENGDVITGADAVYAVDMRAVDTGGDFGEFYGRMGHTDADTGAIVWSAYQGYAVRFTDDWNESGVPGYKIVTMDQPADFWIGTCAESLSGSPLAAKATYDDTIDPSGSPFSGRRPPLLADSRVTVYDDLGMKPGIGERWVIKWDRINERYVYWLNAEPRFHVIKGTSPGVVRADTSFTLGSPVTVQGALPSGTIVVTCDPKIQCPSGQTVYARYDVTKHGSDDLQRWSTADAGNSEWILKGYPDFDASKKMLLTSDANTVEWNEIATVLNWLAGYVAGNIQSIGHDASDVTEWQDDSDACPEGE